MRKSFFASLSELALSSRSEGQKRLQQKAGRTLKALLQLLSKKQSEYLLNYFSWLD
jgi:molybdopterin converting factor small subunit